MGRMKILSGREVVAVLVGFGFSVASQRGSHIKLMRYTGTNERQILTLPLHEELDKGTIKALYRQASRYISEESLKKHFFHD